MAAEISVLIERGGGGDRVVRNIHKRGTQVADVDFDDRAFEVVSIDGQAHGGELRRLEMATKRLRLRTAAERDADNARDENN